MSTDTVERTATEQTVDPDPLVHMWCSCRDAVPGSTSACGRKKTTPPETDYGYGTCVVCVDLDRTGWVCFDCHYVHPGIPS